MEICQERTAKAKIDASRDNCRQNSGIMAWGNLFNIECELPSPIHTPMADADGAATQQANERALELEGSRPEGSQEMQLEGTPTSSVKKYRESQVSEVVIVSAKRRKGC